MRKILSSMVLGISLLLTSCDFRNDEYNSNGESVECYTWKNYNGTRATNKVEVTKREGDKVIYLDDAFNDLKIDKIITVKEGVTNVYRRGVDNGEIFKVRQNEFDKYWGTK